MKWTYLLVSLAYLVACGSESAETRERVTDAASANLEAGLAADLVKVSYKAHAVDGVGGATCDYDRSWLQATNLTEPVRSALNAALDRDPRSAVDACKNSARFSGGYSTVTSNADGALSLVYHFDTVQNGTRYVDIVPVNLDLTSGKFITLSTLLDTAGRDVLIASCTAQWQKLALAEGTPDIATEEACRESLTLYPGEESEHFSFSKAGIYVHIDAHVPANAQHMIPAGGFLVPWSELRGNVMTGPAKRVAASGQPREPHA